MLLEAKDIHKHYGDLHVLKGVDVAIKSGEIVSIVGASGAGKDSIINYAQNHLYSKLNRILFAHRYVTRPATTTGENYVSLSKEEFTRRSNAGLFLMEWKSHNLYYGVGNEVDLWVNRGFWVVVNGSREYYIANKSMFENIIPVTIAAETKLIAERLNTRAREKKDAIAERVQRNAVLEKQIKQENVIWNNGSLEQAGDSFLELLCSIQNREL